MELPINVKDGLSQLQTLLVLRHKKMEKGIERLFSVELKSKAHLKNVTMTNSSHEMVLVEGSIGKLQSAEFAENIVLVVTGDKGILRINLSPFEIKQKAW